MTTPDTDAIISTEQKNESIAPNLEQLHKGYTLKSEEIVELPVDGNAGDKRYTVVIGKDKPIGLEQARNVGVVYIGDVSGQTRAEANLTVDQKGSIWISVRDQEGADTDVYGILAKDEPFILGREFAGQEQIGDTVSSMHCAVGLNEKGEIVVQNLNPTNQTAVRSFVK